VSFVIDLMRRKEIVLQNIRRQNHCVQAALDLIEDGLADVAPLITHRFPLARVQEAFELVDGYRDGVIKALVTL
jgi:L-iditol 2-dehydrogenase